MTTSKRDLTARKRYAHLSRVALYAAIVVAYLGLVYVANLSFGPQIGISDVPLTIAWNYGVLVVLGAIVWVLTRRVAQVRPPVSAAPRREGLFAALLLVLYTLIIIGFWWQFAGHHPRGFAMLEPLVGQWFPGWPRSVLSRFANAAAGGVETTLVVLAVVWWRTRAWPKSSWRLWGFDLSLLVALVAASAVLSVLRMQMQGNVFGIGLTLGSVLSSILPTSVWAVAAFGFQLFVNGIQEEMFFRRYLLPVVQAFTGRWWVSLLVVSALFDAMHIPLLLYHYHSSAPWWEFLLASVFPLQPTGLLLGWIYLRSRNIWPVIVFHTFTTLWVFPFI